MTPAIHEKLSVREAPARGSDIASKLTAQHAAAENRAAELVSKKAGKASKRNKKVHEVADMMKEGSRLALHERRANIEAEELQRTVAAFGANVLGGDESKRKFNAVLSAGGAVMPRIVKQGGLLKRNRRERWEALAFFLLSNGRLVCVVACSRRSPAGVPPFVLAVCVWYRSHSACSRRAASPAVAFNAPSPPSPLLRARVQVREGRPCDDDRRRALLYVSEPACRAARGAARDGARSRGLRRP